MGSIFRSIAHGVVIISLSRLLLKALSFVGMYLVLREVSRADYGLISLALSVSGPTLILTGWGLDDTIFANAARARGENSLVAFRSVLIGFAWTKLFSLVLVTAIILAVRTTLGQEYRLVLERFLVPLLFWIWLANGRALCDAMWQMREQFSRYAQANVLENSVRVAIIIGLFVVQRLSVTSVLWAYVAAKFFSTLWVVSVLRELFLVPERRQGVKQYLSFVRRTGKWEIVRAFLGSLFSGVNQWIVGFILGLEAVAIFSVASAMNSFVAQFSPVRQILYPIIARLSSDVRTSSIVARRMAKYTVWLNSLLVLIAMILAPILVPRVIPNYASSVPLFMVLVWGQVLNGLSASHGPLFFALNEQKYLLRLSLFGTFSACTFLPLLTSFFGLYGAAVENLGSTALIVYWRERYLRRVRQLKTFVLRDLFTWDESDGLLVQRVRAAIRGWLSQQVARLRG